MRILFFQHRIPIYWESTKACFRKYAVFSGRSSRQEYNAFYLFIFFVSILLGMIEPLLIEGLLGVFPYPIFSIIFELAVFLPGWAVMIRRLHDVNRSGWWILINLTIIGIIPFVYWVCVKKSDEGENRFGSNPLISLEVF